MGSHMHPSTGWIDAKTIQIIIRGKRPIIRAMDIQISIFVRKLLILCSHNIYALGRLFILFSTMFVYEKRQLIGYIAALLMYKTLILPISFDFLRSVITYIHNM